MDLKNSRKINLQMYAFTYCSKFNRIGIQAILKDNSGSGEVDPNDIRKAYKRHVLEGYSKNNPKNKIMKYKPLPQENIMEEKVEEDI